MEHPLPPPAWITKRDGRLEPFDADKISRSLFAATESLGHPNTFLARELTDSVLHFLKAEFENAVPTTAQVAELVAKVVRELGQPALAQAYAAVSGQRPAVSGQPAAGAGSSPPTVGPTPAQVGQWLDAEASPAGLLRRVGRACLRAYSLREVFTRDLVAAHDEGLLTLTGLETPAEIQGYHLEVQPAGARDLAYLVGEARPIAGEVLALDGLEHAFRSGATGAEGAVAEALPQLVRGLEQTGLRAVVNLNGASPPRWASDLAEGPLFGPAMPGQSPAALDAVRDCWLGHWAALPAGAPVRLDWHLGEPDVTEANRGRLTALVRRALGGLPVVFVFDRPRRPPSSAEGLDRQHPAVLLAVGLHLPALCARQGLQADSLRYLSKLGSLARLALSAALQKRDFLRRHSQGRPGLRRGFLLDRARLVIVPVGLEAVVCTLTGRSPARGGDSLELGRQILRRLREVLEQDGTAARLETCLDSAAAFTLGAAAGTPAPEHVAGLTPWDPAAPPRQQVRAAGQLHGVAERGTAAVLIPEDRPLALDEAVEIVRYAWRQTDVHRLCFRHATPAGHQLTAPWEEG